MPKADQICASDNEPSRAAELSRLAVPSPLAHVIGLRTGLRTQPRFPHIERTQLDNGIELMECRLPHSNAVAIELVSSIGSQNETRQFHGATHFAEHLICAGTSTPGRETGIEIARLMKKVGGSVNAYTGKDRIGLSVFAPRNYSELALDVTLDHAVAATFRPEAVEQQRGAILGEYSSQLMGVPTRRLHAIIDREVYAESSLAHPVLGTPESVAALTRAQLLRFYHAAFQANRLVASVSGGYDDAFREVLLASLSAMPTHTGKTDFLTSSANAAYSTRSGRAGIFVDYITIGVVYLAIVLPGISQGDKSRVAMGLLHQVIGDGGLDCRINRELREKRGLTYGGQSGLTQYADTGHQIFVLPVQPKNAAIALRLLRDLIADVHENGITESELQNIKSARRNSTILSFESAGAIATTLGSRILLERATGIPFETPEQVLGLIESVTIEEVNNLAKKHLNLENMQVFAVGETDPDTLFNALSAG